MIRKFRPRVRSLRVAQDKAFVAWCTKSADRFRQWYGTYPVDLTREDAADLLRKLSPKIPFPGLARIHYIDPVLAAKAVPYADEGSFKIIFGDEYIKKYGLEIEVVEFYVRFREEGQSEDQALNNACSARFGPSRGPKKGGTWDLGARETKVDKLRRMPC